MEKQSSHSSRLIVVEIADGMLRVPPSQDLPSGAALRRMASRPGSLDELLAWASTNKTEGAVRINEILELITELVVLGRGNGDMQKHRLVWQGRIYKVRANLPKGRVREKSERESLLASELVLKIARYRLAPWYWTTIGDYPIFGWASGNDRPRDEDDPTEEASFTEEDAIIAILDLSREGLLHGIRRCHHCRDWFLAVKANRKFCCVGCQQKFHRSSDDYKAMRRAYMKNLRAAHKKTYLPSPKDRARKQKRERTI